MSKRNGRAPALPEIPPALEALTSRESFAGADRLADAARFVMAQHVQTLHQHLPGVLTGDDPHDVHQARVATRRLRACLEASAPAFDLPTTVGLRKRLRKLARALGEVRDRDVLLIRLRADAQARPEIERAPLQTAIEQVQAERADAHADLIDELRRKRTARLLHDLHTFVIEPALAADQVDMPLLVRHHAGSAVWHEYETVLRFESIMPHASSERLHELRIACKHLRYTAELFAPALGDEANGVIKQVKEMQEHLGMLHDADVAIAYLRQQQPDTTADDDAQPDANTETWGIAHYINAREAERDTLRETAQARFRTLTGAKNRQTLGKLIARL